MADLSLLKARCYQRSFQFPYIFFVFSLVFLKFTYVILRYSFFFKSPVCSTQHLQRACFFCSRLMESAKEPPPQAWKEIMRWISLKYGLDRFSTIWHLHSFSNMSNILHWKGARNSHFCFARPKPAWRQLRMPKPHEVMIRPCHSWSRHCRTPYFLDCNCTMMLSMGLLFGPICCYFRRRVQKLPVIWILANLRNLCTCWRYEAQDAASSQNAWGHGRWICERDVAHDDSTIFLQESSLTFDLWMKQNGLMYVQYMYSAVYTLQVQYRRNVSDQYLRCRTA